ncbi:MAG TPA: hypothetical protein VJY15_08605 [Candidatus Acidoferrum sp.]|nr:hypothetical protein [Candidatus Acidoferrum sp.]
MPKDYLNSVGVAGIQFGVANLQRKHNIVSCALGRVGLCPAISGQPEAKTEIPVLEEVKL